MSEPSPPPSDVSDSWTSVESSGGHSWMLPLVDVEEMERVEQEMERVEMDATPPDEQPDEPPWLVAAAETLSDAAIEAEPPSAAPVAAGKTQSIFQALSGGFACISTAARHRMTEARSAAAPALESTRRHFTLIGFALQLLTFLVLLLAICTRPHALAPAACATNASLAAQPQLSPAASPSDACCQSCHLRLAAESKECARLQHRLSDVQQTLEQRDALIDQRRSLEQRELSSLQAELGAARGLLAAARKEGELSDKARKAEREGWRMREQQEKQEQQAKMDAQEKLLAAQEDELKALRDAAHEHERAQLTLQREVRQLERKLQRSAGGGPGLRRLAEEYPWLREKFSDWWDEWDACSADWGARSCEWLREAGLRTDRLKEWLGESGW